MNNRETASIMLKLIRSELFQEKLSEDLLASIDEEAVASLYRLSKAHDLAHIVGNALSGAGLLQGEAVKKFQKWQYLAIYRYQRILYELAALTAVLEEAEIPYMPLKGTVLREYYPDPSMRTSCDIDILVHPADLDKAKALLVEKLSYRPDSEGFHDIGFFTPSDLNVELHFALHGEDDKRTAKLGDPWDHCTLKEGSSFEYRMTNEFFYAYAMAHAAKHFYIGGCGIRPFMDIVIMKAYMPFDQKAVNRFYELTGLSDFAAYAERLSECWFGDGERDDTVDFMEEYILEGGTYGSMEGYIISIQGDKSGAYYLFRKIFLPFADLKRQYPILNKWPILMPFCQVARWFVIVFSSRRKKAGVQMRASRNLDKEKTRRIVALQKKLKLD